MTELQIARDFGLPLDLVTEATAIVATRGAGKSSGSAVIVEEAFGLGVQSVIFDRTGVYWGLRSNAKGTRAGLGIYVLGGPHGDVPLEPHAGVLIADLVVDSGHSFVLDLSDFSKAGAIKFAADFLERLYDRKARSRSTLLIVMDEAHFYAPQTPRGGFKGDSARLMGAMEDVVGLGRSRGLGVVLTTQRTQALNKAVLDLIETLLVMRMLSPRARDAVQDWIREKHEDDREGVIATLESLPTGTAWVWSPLRGILRKVALRRIRTFDSYATPSAGGGQAAEPSVRKELDLAALGEQMRSTAERAKENDPAELQKRIRALEAELGERPAETVEKVVEKIVTVEVPVFTDADRDAFKHMRGAVAGLVEQTRNVVEVIDPKLAAVIERIEGIALDQTVSRRARQSPAFPPVRPPRDSAPVADARKPQREPEMNGAVPRPQQKILDALGWFEALGVMQPSRIQVALIAGYSSTSGGYGNLIGKLTAAGLVTLPQQGHLALTDAGRALATDPGLPTTNDGVHDAVLSRIAAPQAKILRVLLDRWPDSVARAEIAESTGYSPTSGGFGNLVGKLTRAALAEIPQQGYVRAVDALFPMR